MILQQFIQQASTIAVAAMAFIIWLWLACKMMRYIPAITQRLGLGETPGLVVAVFALWPLFELTYQLFRFLIL